jgi:SAM-dependent methyltransferase
MPSETFARRFSIAIWTPDSCHCLLCASRNICLEEKVATSDLAQGFERLLGRSVTTEFGPHQELYYCHCEDCDLRFFWPPVSGSEAFYESLQQFDWYYLNEKPEYDLATKWISPADRVLELGCGAGNFGMRLGAARYTGLEFSAKAVRMAVEKGLRVLAESAGKHAQHHFHEYDVVCSFQVMEHITDLRRTISECLELLKSGGLFFVCVPSADSYVGLSNNSLLNLPPHHTTHWSDQALRSIASLFRLELLHIEHEVLAPFHRCAYLDLIARRSINKLLGRPNKMLDTSLTARVVSKVSGKIGKFLGRGFDDSRLFPRGHSVLAVYRKLGLAES